MQRICTVSPIVLMFLCSVAGATLLNSGFETNSDWAFTSNHSHMTGSYTTNWSSQAASSYVLARTTGSITAAAYGQISQANVNMTGITGLTFDCKDVGIDQVILMFLVNNTEVGRYVSGGSGGWGRTVTASNIEIEFSETFTGLQNFIIRLQSNASYNPADPKYYYLDNITMIPEPATCALLALCVLPILRKRTACAHK